MIVLNISHIDPVRPMPRWLYTFLIVGLGTLTCHRRKVSQAETTKKSGNKVADHSDTSGIIKVECITTPTTILVEEQSPAQSDTLSAMEKIMSDLHEILSMLKEKEHEDELRKDWRMAAQILDRVFLIIFIVSTTSTMLGMLIVYPMTYH